MDLLQFQCTFLRHDESETSTRNYYRKKSTPYVPNPIAAATTMMKPKAVDSTTPQFIMTYFSPKMPPNMGNIQGMKKAEARMAGKQSKTTQSPNEMMALCHKPPTILECYQVMTKETTSATPLPQQMNETQKSPQTLTRTGDEEMTDNALTATCKVTNASMAAASSNQTTMNKQKAMNRMMFKPWKMIMTMKQNRNPAQTGTMTTTIKEPLLKLRCRIKWWNQAMGKGAKTVH